MGDQPNRSLAASGGSNGRPAHRFGCQWRQQWATSPPLWLPVEAARAPYRPLWPSLEANLLLWLPVEAALGDQPTALVASGGSQDTLPTALAVTGGQLTALAASGGSQGSLTDLSLPVEAALGDQPTALAASGGSQGTLLTALAVTEGQLTALAASGGSQGTLSTALWLPVEAAMGDQPTALAASGGSNGRPAHRFGCQWRQPGHPTDRSGHHWRPTYCSGCQWRQQWATSPPLWLPVEAARAPYRPLWPSLEANLLLWLPVEAALGDQPTALVASGGSQDTLPTALAVTGGQLTALAASGGSQGSLTDLSLPVETALGDQPTALVASGGSQDTLPTALAVTGGQLTALAASGGSQGTLPDLSLSLEAVNGATSIYRFGCQWRQPEQPYLTALAVTEGQLTALAASGGSHGRPYPTALAASGGSNGRP